jgi:hypothetical protein
MHILKRLDEERHHFDRFNSCDFAKLYVDGQLNVLADIDFVWRGEPCHVRAIFHAAFNAALHHGIVPVQAKELHSGKHWFVVHPDNVVMFIGDLDGVESPEYVPLPTFVRFEVPQYGYDPLTDGGYVSLFEGGLKLVPRGFNGERGPQIVNGVPCKGWEQAGEWLMHPKGPNLLAGLRIAFDHDSVRVSFGECAPRENKLTDVLIGPVALEACAA